MTDPIDKNWMQKTINTNSTKQVNRRNERFLMHFVGRALLVLLENSTLEEQACGIPMERNNCGFTSSESAIGISHAQFYKTRGYLTEKQWKFWTAEKDGFSRLSKYHRQLNARAKEKNKTTK